MNLLILTGIFPPDVGGPATYVPRLARSLHENGWNVEVVTAGKTEADREFPYPVHRVSRNAPFRYFQSVPLIRNRADWADALYVNGLELDNYYASFFHTLPTVQKVVGDRSWERYRNRNRGELEIEPFQMEFPGVLTWLERTFSRQLTATNDGFIVPSRYLKSIVDSWGIESDTIHVIYNHAHPPDSIPEETVDWPGSGLNLVCVGRLVPWKRVPQLIRLIGQVDDVNLTVLGDGPDYQACRQAQANAELESRVTLKGSVERGTVWQHLRDADAVVLNSTYEGFPHVLLEAVESGTPAVAANSGGSRELAEFFPGKIHLYDRDEPADCLEVLDSKPLESFDPPTLPEPLQWTTIVQQTKDVLDGTLS